MSVGPRSAFLSVATELVEEREAVVQCLREFGYGLADGLDTSELFVAVLGERPDEQVIGAISDARKRGMPMLVFAADPSGLPQAAKYENVSDLIDHVRNALRQLDQAQVPTAVPELTKQAPRRSPAAQVAQTQEPAQVEQVSRPQPSPQAQQTTQAEQVRPPSPPPQAQQPPLSEGSLRALSIADRVRALLGQSEIEPLTLLAGLVRLEVDSPAHALLGVFGITPAVCGSRIGVDLASVSTDILPVDQQATQAAETAAALQSAGLLATRSVEPRHIFSALLAQPTTRTWLEDLVGSDNLAWVERNLQSWPADQPFTTEAAGIRAARDGLTLPPTVYRDNAADQDLLGFDGPAAALVDIIMKKETVPPLVIGVYGPWGSGKSTFMARVREKLNAAAHDVAEPKLVHVEYDAWLYNDAPRLWAGLVAQVAAKLDEELGWRGRLIFGIRRRSSRFLAALALGAAAIIVAAVGQLPNMLLAQSDWLLGLIGAAIPVAVAAMLQQKPVQDAVNAAAANFDSAPASGVMHSIQEELRGALEQRTRRIAGPDGTTDKTTIAGQIRSNKLKIVVFIDELDRCPLESIVSILEAIKLFLAEDIFIVLIAIDTRVAAEAIRLHYGAIKNPELPREYLEKIVQIPLRVPTAGNTEINTYLNGLMTIAPSAPVSNSVVSRNTDGASATTPPAPPTQTATPQSTPSLNNRRSVRPSDLASRPSLQDTAAEHERLADLAEHLLDSNPRRIKRLLNTYRYLKILNYSRGEPVYDATWQRNMLSWLGFSMRWPAFVEYVLSLESSATPIDDALRDAPTHVERPSTQDLQSYLPFDAVQLRHYRDIAGNFLVENPGVPPEIGTKAEVSTKTATAAPSP